MTRSVERLDRRSTANIVRRALEEDLGRGDITTDATVRSDQRARGVFVVKADCILAGFDVALEAFRQLEAGRSRQRIRRQDGDRCRPAEEIGELEGSARTLLIGERTAAEFSTAALGRRQLARVSSSMRLPAESSCSTRARPRRRFGRSRKYGRSRRRATNHRVGLFDAVLIKDNHIRLAGGVHAPLPGSASATGRADRDRGTEHESARRGARRARRDLYWSTTCRSTRIQEAVRRARGRAKVEISGGVTLERLPEWRPRAPTNVSSGALTAFRAGG